MMKRGFTLAELLIALAILGVIATFTIPKVLQSQQDAKFKAIAKEAAAMVSQAYEGYRLNNTVTSTTPFNVLTPYMNYVNVDTVSLIDAAEGGGTVGCGTYACLTLHNGAKLLYALEPFEGTASTNAIYFYLDPDGVVNANSKSVVFWLYYNGKLTTWKDLLPNTYNNSGIYQPDPTRDPPWFSWN